MPRRETGSAGGWLCALGALAWIALGGAAALAWWLLPHGFPLDHARFYLNGVFPVALALLTVLALAAHLRRGRSWPAWDLLVVGGLLGGGLAARTAFPVTAGTLFLVPVGLGLGGLLLLLAGVGRQRVLRPLALVLFLTGAAGGALTVAACRPNSATTRPLGASNLPAPPPAPPDVPVRLGGRGAWLEPRLGTIGLAHGELQLRVHPLLTFESRSPDGAWTLFVPAREREATPPRLVGADLAARAPVLAWDGLAQQVLRVDGLDRWPEEPVVLDADTTLPRAIHSHLNAFFEVAIVGHEALSIAFATCSGPPVEVRVTDYPRGRPARFACLGPDDTLTIFEAADGEKGPYRRLTRGDTELGEPLVLTFLDRDRPRVRLVVYGFVSQASRALSPTAGWGVAQNAISFWRLVDPPSAPVFLRATLAATGIGRGFDVVTHTAGTYRLRLVIEALDD